MGLFERESEEAKKHNEFNQFATIREHKAKISHELLGAAAAYEASKAWEEHKERNGKPDDHAKAKEILIGIAGGYVDRLVEKHGLEYMDREKAKGDARKRVQEAIDSNGY